MLRVFLAIGLAVGGWRLAGEPQTAQPSLPPTANRQPPTATDSITVTATRTETRLGETAASVVRIDAESLSTTAALTLDDALRQVPGFQLFRRTGSRAANPTA